jgi:hypothetical protein
LAFAVIMTSDNTKVLYLELGATIVLIVAELWLSFLAIRMGPKAIRGMLIAWVISLVPLGTLGGIIYWVYRSTGG